MPVYDMEGHGRYVPEGARDAIYKTLPASLDTITVRELGPLPPEGFPVQGKRKPDLPRPAPPSPQEVAMTPDDYSRSDMRKTTPPVPEGLCEMLKDYPGHIERLQEALVTVMAKPSNTPPLERAVWALEGRLETFMFEARDELKLAEASGDAERIARAKEKENLMLHGRMAGTIWGMRNFDDYFDGIK
ncbi:hypothetical protein OK348_10885 [Flavobacterium sp. MXW15]|uniref:Uncharacterized protein n=1 Tax=Xanthomonas chitinilytica TaxID=2989819 RepID=A0ABT3JXC2_9XANT|nr:hypothetical protein [Xanthomonas sp. H13-6]MCW4455297.1 hypothetical protein [Flavobacterium sp. MXW15]MCW4473124.1 hypothetical protein [Xanthomonas sp. H13-6]